MVSCLQNRNALRYLFSSSAPGVASPAGWRAPALALAAPPSLGQTQHAAPESKGNFSVVNCSLP